MVMFSSISMLFMVGVFCLVMRWFLALFMGCFVLIYLCFVVCCDVKFERFLRFWGFFVFGFMWDGFYGKDMEVLGVEDVRVVHYEVAYALFGLGISFRLDVVVILASVVVVFFQILSELMNFFGFFVDNSR